MGSRWGHLHQTTNCPLCAILRMYNDGKHVPETIAFQAAVLLLTNDVNLVP